MKDDELYDGPKDYSWACYRWLKKVCHRLTFLTVLAAISVVVVVIRYTGVALMETVMSLIGGGEI